MSIGEWPIPGGAQEFVADVTEHRVIAIVRERDAETALRRGRVLMAAGAGVLEVSLTTPGAWEVVERLLALAAGSSVRVGVGTVATSEQVGRAAQIGAAFVLAPTLVEDVVAAATRWGIPSVPGCATPAEMQHAMVLGAALVKVFPASLWSPRALRDLLQALPGLRCVPTGGVSLESAHDWFEAGAVGVGLGSALTRLPDAEIQSRLSALRSPGQ
jgi:2-dehydro-3-deoxyphosphogluconate aldolase / (4S)-4-hydroxy-2-oxoglutarate aldolase